MLKLADISVLENLQAEANSRMHTQSSMSAFNSPTVAIINAFQITVPKLAQKAKPDLATHEYASREAAEKDAAAWRNARIETKKDQYGKTVYILAANGQRFVTTHEVEASAALEQAKASKVVETP